MLNQNWLTLLLGAALLLAPRTVFPQQHSSDTPTAPKLTSSDIATLRRSAEQGEVAAERKLAEAYDKGNGVTANEDSAAKWYRKAADQGDAQAQNVLGVMYRLGRGVPKSEEDAVRWYHSAAKQGYAQAMFNLGAAYYNGDGVSSDLDLSYAWFLLAREAGNAAAKDAVARGAQEKTSPENAFEIIGAMYEKGVDLPKNPTEALRWYGEAAKESDPAKVKFAAKLIAGGVVGQDYARAMELCRAAADHEYAPGQYCIGYLYQVGLGVEKDPKEALKRYKLAAAPVFPRFASNKAMFALGEMYSRGDGVPADRAEGYYWFVRAYASGLADAKAKCQSLRPQMSDDETKQLEKKLRESRFDPKKVFATMQ